MHLAIFMDARAVAGDADLLHQARAVRLRDPARQRRLPGALCQRRRPVRRTRRLVGAADPPRGRDEQPFDLKKLGTFPIVHGVRALALQYRVHAR